MIGGVLYIMFFSTNVLTKKGPLARIWIAAFEAKALKRPEITGTNIAESVESIIHPEVPIALRTSGHLLLGIVRIHSKKIDFLLQDAVDAKLKIQISVARATNTLVLPASKTTSKRSAVTLALQELPSSFGMLDFDLDAPPTFVVANAGLSTISTHDAMGNIPQDDDMYDVSRQSLTQQEINQPFSFRFENGMTDVEDPEMLRGEETDAGLIDIGEQLGFDAQDFGVDVPAYDVDKTGEVSALNVSGSADATNAPTAADSTDAENRPQALPSRRKVTSRRKRAHADPVTELDSRQMRQMIQDASALCRNRTLEVVLEESAREAKRAKLSRLPSILSVTASGSSVLQRELSRLLTISGPRGSDEALAVPDIPVANFDDSIEQLRGADPSETMVFDGRTDDAPEKEQSQPDLIGTPEEPLEPSGLSFGGEDMGFSYEEGVNNTVPHAEPDHDDLASLLNTLNVNEESITFGSALFRIRTTTTKRAKAAKAFYQLLNFQSNGTIEAVQESAYAPISIRPLKRIAEVSA